MDHLLKCFILRIQREQSPIILFEGSQTIIFLISLKFRFFTPKYKLTRFFCLFCIFLRFNLSCFSKLQAVPRNESDALLTPAKERRPFSHACGSLRCPFSFAGKVHAQLRRFRNESSILKDAVITAIPEHCSRVLFTCARIVSPSRGLDHYLHQADSPSVSTAWLSSGKLCYSVLQRELLCGFSKKREATSQPSKPGEEPPRIDSVSLCLNVAQKVYL